MFTFGKRSVKELETCDGRLQHILLEAIECAQMDFTILQGHRSVEEQEKLFHEGKTKIDGVSRLSKHNFSPSLAVDLAPYPINWNDRDRFLYLGGFILGVAGQLDIKLRWGGDWNSNGILTDQSFFDLPHFELVQQGDV